MMGKTGLPVGPMLATEPLMLSGRLLFSDNGKAAETRLTFGANGGHCGLMMVVGGK